MDPVNFSLLAILCSIIAYVFYQAWKTNQHWKEKNIPHIKPWLFLGNSAPIFFMKMSAGECHKSVCDQFPNEPVVGFYDFMKPVLLVKDADMIEKILIKDFVHFVDHGFAIDEDSNPLESNLFNMTGKRWKALRNRLSPIFTTGKLRNMYGTMADCGDQLVDVMDKTENVDMRDILGRFAMDVIGSCAFGIDAGNLANPDNEFRRMGKKSFEFNAIQFLKFIFITNFPALFKKLNLSFNRRDVIKYFTTIINNAVKHRRETGQQRNDFVQLLMQLQDKGYVEMHTKDEADDYLNIEQTYTTEKFEMSNDQLTGQAFVFLTAGFEGTTISMTFTLYELAKHPEIQEKVREEVKREVKNAGGLEYDALREMKYLEQCINEAMRKYPPAPMLFRACTKEYTLPNGLTLKPGETLMISLVALHSDPNIYPEPEKFKPERFDPDKTLPPCAHLPFGNGPRICIAMRFAMMQIKYCLAKLLMNYKFTLSSNIKEPMEYSKRTFFTAPKDKILFNLSKIKE